ncbi:MAG: hypothetical protein ACM3MK_09425 [Chitinophagales bacterium]
MVEKGMFNFSEIMNRNFEVTASMVNRLWEMMDTSRKNMSMFNEQWMDYMNQLMTGKKPQLDVLAVNLSEYMEQWFAIIQQAMSQSRTQQEHLMNLTEQMYSNFQGHFRELVERTTEMASIYTQNPSPPARVSLDDLTRRIDELSQKVDELSQVQAGVAPEMKSVTKKKPEGESQE